MDNNFGLFPSNEMRQQNGQGSFHPSAQILMPEPHHQIEQGKMNPVVLPQAQNPYYNNWNEFIPTNHNWGYTFPNYALPPAPIAVPVSVSDYPVNQGNDQVPITTMPTSFPFSSLEGGGHANEVTGINISTVNTSFFTEYQIAPPQPAFQQTSGIINAVDTNMGNSVPQYGLAQHQNQGVKPENGIQSKTNHSSQQSVPGKADKPKRRRRKKSKDSPTTLGAGGSSLANPSNPRKRTLLSPQDSISPGVTSINSEDSNSTGRVECTVCNRFFASKLTLRNHQKMVHKLNMKVREMGKPTKYRCEVCGKFFCNMCSLKRHQNGNACTKAVLRLNESSQPGDENNSARFASTGNQIEIGNLAAGNHSFQSGLPENISGTTNNRIGHPQTHGGPSQISAIIKENDSSLDSTNDKNRRDKCESCQICNKKFTTKSAVRKHLKRTHGGATLESAAAPKVKTPNQPSYHQPDTSQATPSTSSESFSTVELNRNLNLNSESMDTGQKSQDKSLGSLNKPGKVKCEYCDASMLKGNLPRHKRSHHATDYEREKDEADRSPLVKAPTPAAVKRVKSENRQDFNGSDSNLTDDYNSRNEKPDVHQYSAAWIDNANISEIGRPPDFTNTTQNHPAFILNSQSPQIEYKYFNDSAILNHDPASNFISHNPELAYRSFPHHQGQVPFTPVSNSHEMGYQNINQNGIVAHQRTEIFNHSSQQPPSNITLQNHATFIQQTPFNANTEFRNLSASNLLAHPVHTTFIQTPSNSSVEYLGQQPSMVPQQSPAPFFQSNHSEMEYKHFDGRMAGNFSNEEGINSLKLESTNGGYSTTSHPIQPQSFVQTTAGPQIKTPGPGRGNVRVAKREHSQPDKEVNQDEAQCPICEKMVLKSELYRHKTSHELVCHICGKDDVCLPDVPAHGTTHVASLICEVCGHKAQAKIKLWEHMNMHFRVKPLICLECGWSFGNSGSVQYHMKTQHSVIDDLNKCAYCDKTFVTDQARRGHELSHYGTTCPFCKQEFLRKKDLGEHIKAQHKGKRPQPT